MNKKFLTVVLSAICACLILCALAACSFGEANNAPRYTITFATVGGSEVTPLTFSSDVNDLVMPTPVKKGYDFAGWFSDENYSVPFDYKDVTSDVTVYAKWTEKSVYTVKFETNGGTEYEDAIVLDGDYVVLPTPVNGDFVFNGWYDNASFSGTAYYDQYTPRDSVTLYALFDEYEGIVVELEANGGTVFENKFHYSGDAIALPTPAYYGYAFKGWFDNAELLGDSVTVVANPTESVTYYAKWEKVSYLYLYYGASTDFTRYEYEPGTAVDSSSFFTPAPLNIDGFDYAFTGWVYEDASVDYSVGAPVGETVTLEKEETIIIATYEPFANLSRNGNGDIVTTGNVAYEYFDNCGGFGEISGDFEFDKGVSGGVGVAFRMDMSGENYAFQDAGSTYLSVVFVPANGSIQTGQVVNGLFEHFSGITPLTDLPTSFQEKYEGNAHISANLRVELKADSFDIYIDNEFVKTINETNAKSGRTNEMSYNDFIGESCGFRSSVKGAIIKNLSFRPYDYVKIDFNYGENNNISRYYEKGEAISFVASDYTESGGVTQGYVVNSFAGWYTQEVGGEKVEIANAETVLFAHYTKKTYYDTAYVFDGEYSFAAGEKVDTGVKLDFSKDFVIETTVQVSSLGQRYVIANTWDGTSPFRFLNIEIYHTGTYANSFRVQIGKNGSGSSWRDYWSKATNASYVAEANQPYAVRFEWEASKTSFKLYVNDTLYISGTHEEMQGFTSSGTLCFGAGDHRGGTTFKAITVNGFKLTVRNAENSEITFPIVTGSKTFVGWYSDSEYVNAVTEENYLITEFTQFYAKFE